MALGMHDVTGDGKAAAPMMAGTLARQPRTICGDFNMRIARDGTWYYQGSPIGRKELVCLFASVLKREADGSYWLETPAERGRIEVEDAPFVAVELTWGHCCGEGACDTGTRKRPARQCLTFRTNLGEMVSADEDHPIRVEIDPVTREPRPYVTVRPGLEARISRPVFYELVALAQPETVDGREVMGVWSQGVFFIIDDSPAEDDDSVEEFDDELA
ncbi:hypothetical protein SAMN02745194_01774 [Roseomonas rosea]|uniref:Proteophosphoglycan n=1 Tax=Muricoccus roseus TaxID=198092 RepID=A0A1M6GJE7_9PROT|nr:hypothetical protein SAMN02745194_01774 [Roseomonas rosea]